jgi:hypothetical protein
MRDGWTCGSYPQSKFWTVGRTQNQFRRVLRFVTHHFFYFLGLQMSTFLLAEPERPAANGVETPADCLSRSKETTVTLEEHVSDVLAQLDKNRNL